ncbi:GNL3L/Grn1 putative GTPase-domain-containing protein [Gilbertella persicaria]|uniref:Guanine nucleotide-binding protein-like 3 N-terminal domain-containing protein n=1 Tax=Rhizopus stolonifer TaxID=4846 RepID=A0A367KQ32_RHIST|nr:GNL3L/Grn1 putative GTPase-domain-containing protein [Gilbertella persicaria]KAI8087904.1 GNL3L/Grn1 putative GTPase-domain-containing protein [Gilbertella persicaria]RCI04230.1 hypothetical protein CU098_007455 [Rhizopus stolonifer]
MVPKKVKSKRVTLHRKHRILGKIKEAHRKEKRAAKKNPSAHHNKTKKDPGIPNEWPFKEQILNEIQAQKNEAEEEKLRRKQMQQVERAKAKKAAKKAEIASNIAAAKAAKAAAEESAKPKTKKK